MTLKFMEQEKGESVDMFYGRIRDVLHQCEYDPVIQKVLEAETLKFGLTNTKIKEKVYALQKDADASRVLDTARAEEQAQTLICEVEKIRRDYNLVETKSAEELRQQKKSFSKKSKTSSDGRTKNQYHCKRCGRKQCPAYGKECNTCKKKGQFAEQCHSKAIADASSKRFGQQKQILGPRKSFAKQLQTQEIAKQTSQTLTK